MLKYLFCDADGVPALVQRMQYIYGDMSIEVTFFNGEIRYFAAGDLVPSIDIMQLSPTRMQFLEAEQRINELAKTEWKKWFPNLRVV